MVTPEAARKAAEEAETERAAEIAETADTIESAAAAETADEAVTEEKAEGAEGAETARAAGIAMAAKAARAAIESTYEGICTVIEYGDITDGVTKITRQGEIVQAEGLPCRLSFERLAAAVGTDTAAAVAQGVKLFIAPETSVRAGSKIIVTQNGVTAAYAASGAPAVYPSHMEIWLELFRGWA